MCCFLCRVELTLTLARTGLRLLRWALAVALLVVLSVPARALLRAGYDSLGSLALPALLATGAAVVTVAVRLGRNARR